MNYMDRVRHIFDAEYPIPSDVVSDMAGGYSFIISQDDPLFIDVLSAYIAGLSDYGTYDYEVEELNRFLVEKYGMS